MACNVHLSQLQVSSFPSSCHSTVCTDNFCFRVSGYANEVGESFRALVHVNVVRFSYVVASGYVVADSIHKGNQAAEVRRAPNAKPSSDVSVARPAGGKGGQAGHSVALSKIGADSQVEWRHNRTVCLVFSFLAMTLP